MSNTHHLALVGALASLIVTLPAHAQTAASGRMLGQHSPFGLNDLPLGQFRSRLEQLPPQARQRALEWLHRFDFPELDLPFMRIDDAGGVFYADTLLPDTTEAAPAATPTLQEAAADQPFLLHSRPGAANTLFLDFDGDLISGTAWNSGLADPLYAQPFDLDGSPLLFSADESAHIAEIWHRVAEDLAPFDIDVTTEDPGLTGPRIGHLLVTRSVDANGVAMPSSSAGGVAYIGVFGQSYYNTYAPALVYYNNLGGGFAAYVAEAASHEFGHNLGLSHDGTSTQSYYPGLGSDSSLVSWAPIMGVGYYKNVTQWSRGEYPDANNVQDDLEIIRNLLGSRVDDHGNEFTQATPLWVDGNQQIVATTPSNDPHNSYGENKGLIEGVGDVDLFSFSTGSGPVDLRVTPAWAAYPVTLHRGANLDLQASLYDSLGNLVASSEPADNTNARLSLDLPAGSYYLAVTGVGTPNYSDYDSAGLYFINGQVSAAALDTTPPSPNPMSWAQPPSADRSSVTLSATTATDAGGGIQYDFLCLSGAGCADSGWQSATQFTLAGLSPGTLYRFQVKARDGAGNETALSAVAEITTLSNGAPLASDDSATLAEDAAAVISVLDNDSDPDGDPLTLVSVSAPGFGTVSHDGQRITYTPAANFNGSDSFSYRVEDSAGAAADARVTLTVTPVNDAPVAADDSAGVALGGSVTIAVLANDSDIDQDPLSLVAVTQGGKGSVAIVGDSLVYTAGNKRGGDSFSYSVSDGQASASATVLIDIGGKGGGGSTGGGKCNPKKGC